MRGASTRLLFIAALCAAASGCATGISMDRPLRFAEGERVQEGGEGRAHAATGAIPIPLVERWRRSMPGRSGGLGLVTGGGTVIAAGVRGGAEMFALADGASVGSISTRGTIGAALAGWDSLLYVPFAGPVGAGLLCADLVEDHVRWMRAGASIESPPTIDAQGVTVCAYDGSVQHFAHGDSLPRWTRRLSARCAAGACAADSLVLLGCADGTLHALSLRDGAERWSFSCGAPIAGAPARADSLVFITDRTGTLRALRLQDGTERWTSRTGAACHAGPAASAGLVAAACSDGSVRVYAQDDGRALARSAFDRPIVAAPLVVAEPGTVPRIAVCTLGGTVAVLDAADGRLLWSETLGERISASPVWSGGMLVVSTEEGRVVAFGPVVTKAAP